MPGGPGILVKLAKASLMGIYGKKKCGNFRKVLRESFTGKFYRKFYGEVLRESFTGKWGARFGLRLGKIADPPQVQ